MRTCRFLALVLKLLEISFVCVNQFVSHSFLSTIRVSYYPLCTESPCVILTFHQEVKSFPQGSLIHPQCSFNVASRRHSLKSGGVKLAPSLPPLPHFCSSRFLSRCEKNVPWNSSEKVVAHMFAERERGREGAKSKHLSLSSSLDCRW